MTVVLNRVDLSPVFNPQQGEATKTFALADRKYLLTASVEDRAGNKTELIRRFTVDTVPPDLTVTAPETGQPIQATEVRVAGKALDATTSIRSLRVNGIEIPLLPAGEFAAPFPLAEEGMNLLKIEAVDEAGNIAAKEVSLIRDTCPPKITIESPPAGAPISTPAIILSGTVTDTGPLRSVTLNGNPVPVTRGAFKYPVSLSPGANTFLFSATDAAGNTGTVRWEVILPEP